MDIKEKIIEIIALNSEMDSIKEYLHNNDDLTKIGLNSISFIKMIVNFETDFGIEFNDEDLDFSQFVSLNQLWSYIEDMVAKNENRSF